MERLTHSSSTERPRVDPAILDLLDRKTGDLNGTLPLEWRYPGTPPRHPLHARPHHSWPVFKPGSTGPWKKHGKNWFYSDFAFPEMKNGVPLLGTTAQLFVYGWMPFTLWLDGQELFRERHAWLATGPIADPFPFPVVPGRLHRFALCIEPTELPGNSVSVHVELRIRECMDLAVQTGAAAAQLRYAQALAARAPEVAALSRAAARLDLGALRREEWSEALSSIDAMEAALTPLTPKARALTLHLIGHSHIDMDWMWTWKDTVHCIRRDLKAATDMMDDYPELTFTHSQIPTYEAIRKTDPDVFAKIRRRLAEGRWENAAGTWVEGDLNMADGESIARHMLYASDWSRRHLGARARVLWEPDTFGHPGNMPQLARLGELDCYFHWRCNPDKHDAWPVWKWIGIDGTPITCFSSAYGSDLAPRTLIQQTLRHHRDGRREGFHVWGMGDHGGALSRFNLEILKACRDKPVMPTFRFSTMKRLLAAVRSENPRLKTATGQTYTLFEGCFTTHASIKRWNRKCESALLTAEALSALAGLERRAQLRRAWLPVLFNHFHDIFDGAAVHDSYKNAHLRAATSLKTATRIRDAAMRRLLHPTRAHARLTLFNPLGFSRTEPVRVALPANTVCLVDAAGNPVPIQKSGDQFVFVARNVPAFSQTTYRIRSRPPARAPMAPMAASEEGACFKVETPGAVIRIHKESGALAGYYHKTLKREFVAYGLSIPLTHTPSTHLDLALNVFQVRDEAHNGMTAWLMNDALREENLLRGASVTLAETGPVFARFRVRHRFRSSRIDEDIVLYRDVERVDFEARIDWRERGSSKTGVPQLKVSFAGALSAVRARTEGPFAIREIPADGMEMPTQKWADLSGREAGFALYNDSKYGMDALGPRLRLTLLRNPYYPDPETDNGRHVVRFAFEPHGPSISNAELSRRAMAFNRPLVPAVGGGSTLSPESRLRISGADSVVCTALRHAEHSRDLLLRLFQTEDRPCRITLAFGAGLRAAREVNFLENPTGLPLRPVGGAIRLRFRPFEVKTLRIRTRGGGG